MTLVSSAGHLGLAALFALAPIGRASAQENPPCDAIPGLTGPVIYGVGGSAQTPLIGRIASALSAAADPITIVYQDSGACKAMEALDPTVPAESRYLTGEAKYWTSDSATANKVCVLPANTSADFGSMQQYPEFCPNVDGLYDGIGDFKGPVGTVALIVPTQSSQSSISTDAAHFIFGFGDESGVDPWTDDAYIIRRNATSAVQLYLAAAADLPDAFNPNVGVDAKTNGNSINWTAAGGVRPEAEASAGVTKPAVTVPNYEATIGFVSGEQADNNRDKVRTLAYQHRGQECAYWPDSSPTSFDKINVRRGLYYLWADVHLFAPIEDDGSITDENVAKFIGYVTGDVEAPAELPILDVFIDNGNIPRCAMQVQRDGDLGALSSFQPGEPCGCYFEERANGESSCEACEDDGDCPSSDPVCRHGFCEVK